MMLNLSNHHFGIRRIGILFFIFWQAQLSDETMDWLQRITDLSEPLRWIENVNSNMVYIPKSYGCLNTIV